MLALSASSTPPLGKASPFPRKEHSSFLRLGFRWLGPAVALLWAQATQCGSLHGCACAEQEPIWAEPWGALSPVLAAGPPASALLAPAALAAGPPPAGPCVPCCTSSGPWPPALGAFWRGPGSEQAARTAPLHQDMSRV